MDDEGPLSRRRYLALIGASGLGGLAGCGGQTDSGRGTTPSPSSGTDTATPTGTATDTIGATETPDQWDVNPLEQDKLVGAHYYPWYRGEDGYGKHTERPWTDHTPYTPELGTYDSRDPDVINQHIQWAVENGINWFLINTGHPRTDKGRVIEDSYLEAELSDQIHWSVGTGLNHLPVKDEEGRWVIDDPENIEALRWFMEEFEQEWFDHPNYLHIDGRPAVFDFTAAQYTGDIDAAFDEAMSSLDNRPYMIGNPPAIWFPELETPEDVFAAYDAVKTYIDLPWRDDIDARDTYADHWDTLALKWRLMTSHHGLDYIPGVIPGADDTEMKWDGRTHHEALHLTADEFGQLCDNSLDYIDESGPNAVIVTTWNEFPEGTSVEPTEEYGHTRLETVKEHLGQAEPTSIDADSSPFVELEFDRTVTPGSGDARPLAFFFTEFGLYDDFGEIRSYDIGNYPEEPAFIDGVYHPSESQGVSGRWLGGEGARSSLYIHPETADAIEAVLRGWPAGNQDILANVYVDGERTDQVRLDPGSHAEYPVSLVE